ncbi:hypothetical protein H5410_028568, partial [Solanum commersonii]
YSGKVKAPDPLELRLEQESLDLYPDLPENTTCLSDCEVVDILKKFQDTMVALSIEPPGDGFHLTQIRPLKQHGVSDGELCMIANFRLESVDAVFALVPSL